MLMRQRSAQNRPWTRHGQRILTCAILCAATVLYLAVTCWIAFHKPLWTDEFFTFYLAGQPSLSELWQALSTGADQHPPLFYLIVRLAMQIGGHTALAVRTPGILAFWVLCLSMFWLVAHRVGTAGGLVAMLLPLVGGVYEMAYEARGYPLVLGFSGLALLGWQRAREHRLRPWALCLLSLGLMGAVGCHYYAVLLVIPLGLAELCRTIETRRIDPLAWPAIGTALLPLVVCLPLLQQAANFSPHFWAQPTPRFLLVYFNFLVGWSGVTPLVLCLVVFGALAVGWPRGAAAAEQTDFKRVPASELILAGGLLSVPAIVLLVALLWTNAFHFRYAIITVPGAALLAGFTAARVFALFRPLRGAVLAVLLVWFLLLANYQLNVQRLRERNLREVAAWLGDMTPADLPIVLGDSELWYQLRYYAPPKLAERCQYLADPDRSVHLLGHDTVDRCGLALRPWFPCDMQPYAPFLQQYPQFVIFTGLNDEWNWLLPALVEDGAQVRMLGLRGKSLLARVGVAAEPLESRK